MSWPVRLLAALLLAAPFAASGPACAAPSAAKPAPAPIPAAPEIGPGSVLRPVFTLADGTSYTAGTAFAAELDGQTLLLTAHHLLGPAGGLPAQIGPDELLGAIKSARATDAWSGQKVGMETNPARVPGAHAMGEDGAGDLAVFRLPESYDRIAISGTLPFHALPLATANPKVGDPVWLAAAVEGSDAHLFAARVVEVSPGWLFFEYVQPTLELRATSGAPIVNAKGEVVGINLGGGADKGKTIGAAGPVSTIRANLAAALKP